MACLNKVMVITVNNYGLINLIMNISEQVRAGCVGSNENQANIPLI